VNVKVCNAVRLGKKGNRPRSLLTQTMILHNCNAKLRGKEIPQNLAKMFITPDMTPKERENNKAKLAELNKNGKSYKINKTGG